MATLGTAGPNKNFAPAFTVPGTMTLLGYTRDKDIGGVYCHTTVRVKVNTPFPLAKYAAVIAAAKALIPGTTARAFRSGYGAASGYSRIDIEFGAPSSGYSKGALARATQVTTILADTATAIAA